MDATGIEPSGAPARVEPAAPSRLDGVVTYHLNPYASGVVRFNELLAQHLGVPYMGLGDERAGRLERPLLSFKVSEMSEADRASLERMLEERGWRFDVYVHDWSNLPLERRLAAEATRVWCGNDEIADEVRGLNPRTQTVWTPGLLMDQRTYEPTQISVFSFGMAHKIQTAMFRRLRDLLEQAGQTYTVYVSAATHETKSIGDAQSIYDEMNEVFPRGLYFMGNLSDVAVYNQLQNTTFFAAFFPQGVRANNTSVAAAMEHGSVVITNLDEHSPPHLVHMKNVIDINRLDALPSDPLELKRISMGAMEAARARDWPALAERIGA